MKICYILAIFLLPAVLPFSGMAQTTIEFAYDASGNREHRTVISLKSTGIPADSLLANQFTKPLEEQVGLQEVKIYPNPTKGLLRIDFPYLHYQEASIQVHDSNGRLVRQQSASGSNQVDLSDCPSGFYILIIRSGQEKKEWKIIKE